MAVTALAFAQDLAADLALTPLSPPFHAQLGDVVVDCPGTTVTVTNIVEVDPTGGAGTGNCDAIEMANIIVITARDCSFVSRDDGTTDWDAQDRVSAQQDADAAILWDQAGKWRADAWYLPPGFPPTMTFTNSGGLATVTLTLQLPTP